MFNLYVIYKFKNGLCIIFFVIVDQILNFTAQNSLALLHGFMCLLRFSN